MPDVSITAMSIAARSVGYTMLADEIQERRLSARQVAMLFWSYSVNPYRSRHALATILFAAIAARFKARPDGHTPQPELRLAKAALGVCDKADWYFRRAKLRAIAVVDANWPIISGEAAHHRTSRITHPACHAPPCAC
jgi:hypothetical protein